MNSFISFRYYSSLWYAWNWVHQHEIWLVTGVRFVSFTKIGILFKVNFNRNELCRVFVLQLSNQGFGNTLSVGNYSSQRGTENHWEIFWKFYILQRTRIQVDIFQNYKEERLFLTKYSLINMNQLIMSQESTGKILAYYGGTKTVVWNICSYQVSEMVGTNASTNKKHIFLQLNNAGHFNRRSRLYQK